MNDRLTGPSILALVQGMDGPALWRVLLPFTALGKAGYPAGWDMKNNDLLEAIAPAFDAYLLPRMSWLPEHRRIAEQWFMAAKRGGKTIIYECDDDCFTQAETLRRVDLEWTDGKSFERLEAERFERIWAMQQCDGVTVSTQRLATIVRGYTDKPVVVVPNAIDLPWFRGVVRSTERQTQGLTIGWAGGRRHDRDVEMMAEAWGRIAYRTPDVTFVVQGWLPKVIPEHVPEDRLLVIPWLPLERYPHGYAEIDIGCCAVADTPFNRPKSNIKAMEYAAAGAAVVASPTLYGALVVNGSSGFLAESAGEWEDALSELIERPSLRSMMATRLLRTVERKHSLARNLHKWPAAWAQIEASAQSHRILMGTGGPSSFRGVISA
jgi:glycosyltransferase involved in cell wall biosynthesis